MNVEDRYKHGDIECIQAIKAALSTEEFRGFCKGSVIKYVWREDYKGHDEDLEKGVDYLLYALGYADECIPTADIFDAYFVALFDKLDEKKGH